MATFDFDGNARLAKWLAAIPGVKSLVILGHAGEGTFPHPRRAA